MMLQKFHGVAISVGLCEYIYSGPSAGLEADTEASLYLDYSVAGIDLSAAFNKVLDGAMGTTQSLVHHMVLTFLLVFQVLYLMKLVHDDING